MLANMPDALAKEFLTGRTPPTAHPRSSQSLDFWREQVQRCVNGFEYKGTRLTKWHYFMLNFMKIDRIISETETGLDLPSFSQEDDWLFKQIEEAEQAQMGICLLTARGFGKSYTMAAIIAQTYTFYPKSHSILSSSTAKPSQDLFSKVDTALKYLPRALRHNRLKDIALTKIMSGLRYFEGGEEKEKGFLSQVEQATYGDNAGKTRGTRPKKQIFEESGAWTESASLIDCYNMSLGSFFRGSIMTGQPMMIGTGGQMKSGATRDVQTIYYNPEAFRMYPVANPRMNGKKTCIMIPANYKREGFYDGQSGKSDLEGALANIKELRSKLESQPASYNQFLQEYPLNEHEMFTVNGTNKFNQFNINRQFNRILEDPEFQRIERGRLEWVKDEKGKIVGVKWELDELNGKIEIVRGEHPRLDLEGNPYNNLYIGGLDSIDQGSDDSMSEDGSKMALYIKKRFLSIEDSYNRYVCRFVDRPRRVEEGFENVLKILWYFNARVNLEYTKISIVPFFRVRNQYWRFVQRPVIAQADKNTDKYTTLIGTQMTTPIIAHMNLRLQALFEDNCDDIFFPTMLEQGKNYEPDNQTQYDEIVAVGLCEMADEDMEGMGLIARPLRKTVAPTRRIGYYTDPVTGYKVRGIIPESGQHELAGAKMPQHIAYKDMEKQEVNYYASTPSPYSR